MCVIGSVSLVFLTRILIQAYRTNVSEYLLADTQSIKDLIYV
jgi:hypothetical protein